MSYADFLKSKGCYVERVGFNPESLSDQLYPFQADIVRWATRLGRAAIFADCGMGKTLMQLEWARLVCEHTKGNVLVLAPLAVARQTVREAEHFGMRAKYCRSMTEVEPGITVANYEMLSHFDAGAFTGVVLDESSILKAFNGKTRTAIVEVFARTPYRLACTATPAPNDFMELGNHSEFLGVMRRTEMLSMFFAHDGGSTKDWRVKGHAEADFWKWVCKWAVMIRRPSDLGYSDGAFVLPPLRTHEHVVNVDHVTTRKAGMLFALEAHTLQERREARKTSIDARVTTCAQLVADEPRSWLIWCNLNAEGDALEAAIPGAVQISGSDSSEHKETAMFDFASGRIPVLISKPSVCGFGMNFQICSNVAFVGLSDSYEQFYQAIRRCWRFGQRNPVDCHVIISELEGAVVANIQRKEEAAEKMVDGMVAVMSDLMRAELRGTTRDFTSYEPRAAMHVPDWLETETL